MGLAIHPYPTPLDDSTPFFVLDNSAPDYKVRWLGASVIHEPPSREKLYERIDVDLVRALPKKLSDGTQINRQLGIEYVLANHQVVFEKHGLKCYGTIRHAEPVAKGVYSYCIGKRTNGELLLLYGGDSTDGSNCRTRCWVQYYSEREELEVVYFFPNKMFQNWRQIDDTVWTNLHAWIGK